MTADRNSTDQAFISAAILAAEASIRSYDTKAQIAGATFVLSLSPLGSLTGASQKITVSPGLSVVVGVATCLVLSAFLSVLVPQINPEHCATDREKGKRNLFFISPVITNSINDYVDLLRACDIKKELAYELIKLSAIRERKRASFDTAIWATVLYYFGFMLTVWFES